MGTHGAVVSVQNPRLSLLTACCASFPFVHICERLSLWMRSVPIVPLPSAELISSSHACYSCPWVLRRVGHRRYASYALLFAVIYVAGFPLSIFVLLYRRRHKLFGDAGDPYVATTRATYGFLYEDYGPSAWWWEVEELLRKLLLSAVVVLFESGSPVQVRTRLLIVDGVLAS